MLFVLYRIDIVPYQKRARVSNKDIWMDGLNDNNERDSQMVTSPTGKYK